MKSIASSSSNVVVVVVVLSTLCAMALTMMTVQVEAQRELTDNDFKDALNEGPTFVKFYAPWCGHCKRLAPTWTDLSEQVKGANIVKVDCTKQKETCNAHGVRGYPTLKFFKAGDTEGEKYQGARDLNSLKSWVEQRV